MDVKAVVLGAAGMLGHVVTRHLESTGLEVVGVSRQGTVGRRSVAMDLRHQTELRDLLKREGGQWVINAAGRIPAKAGRNAAEMIYINAELPRALAGWAAEDGFRVVHVSTDCVFDGSRGQYRVSERCDADDDYGRSKALGELRDGRNITLRTSIVGPELGDDGQGLLAWYLRQNEAEGWTSALWSGVTTVELARLIAALVTGQVVTPTSLWQFSAPRAISKWELLHLVEESGPKNLPLVKAVPGKNVDKSLVNNLPELWPVLPYDRMFAEMWDWVALNQDLYAG